MDLSNENLDQLRQRIDSCDKALIDILSTRMQVSRAIGNYKLQHHMSTFQSARYEAVLASRIKQAVDAGLNPDFMRTVIEAIHEESVKQQDALSANSK